MDDDLPVVGEIDLDRAFLRGDLRDLDAALAERRRSSDGSAGGRRRRLGRAAAASGRRCSRRRPPRSRAAWRRRCRRDESARVAWLMSPLSHGADGRLVRRAKCRRRGVRPSTDRDRSRRPAPGRPRDFPELGHERFLQAGDLPPDKCRRPRPRRGSPRPPGLPTITRTESDSCATLSRLAADFEHNQAPFGSMSVRGRCLPYRARTSLKLDRVTAPLYLRADLAQVYLPVEQMLQIDRVMEVDRGQVSAARWTCRGTGFSRSIFRTTRFFPRA